MKKVFIMFLAFAYLNCYLGCTTTRVIRMGVSELSEVNYDSDIEVVRNDSTNYFFRAGACRVIGDTLRGKIFQDGDPQSKLIKIPLKDIEQINVSTEEIKTFKTVLVTLLGVSLILVVIAVVSFSNSYAGVTVLK